jgi:hypothetical protein
MDELIDKAREFNECPVCGMDIKRYVTKHFAKGKLCTGTPVIVRYIREDARSLGEWTAVEDPADVPSDRYLATVGLSGMRNATVCELNRSFGNWYLPNMNEIFHGIVYAIRPIPAPYQPQAK